jgi:hypothetical protein
VTVADEDLGELVRLIRGADSVELKLSVPESQQRSTIADLGMDPLDAEIRQVYFFDTPGLALDAAGVVVRARRVQGKGDDSVVKLRPVVPGELPVRPIFVLKLKFRPAELDRRLVAELWLYPDDSRILELSTRTRSGDAFQAVAEVRAYLAEHHVAVSAEQQTKTRRALEFFGRRLAAA